MLGIFRRIHTMRGIDKFHKLFGRGISHMWGCTMWSLPETERQKVKTLSHMYLVANYPLFQNTGGSLDMRFLVLGKTCISGKSHKKD